MDGFELAYEYVPAKKYKLRGVEKMSKEAKEAKVYAKSRTEHYKDIVIAILVTGIIAFCLGSQYQSHHVAEIQKAVSAVQPVKK